MNSFLPHIIIITAFLIGITFHEFCHALAAYLLGDDTAKKLGRLTLNPISHIDPLGLLFLLLIKIGWAKPVPFDPRNFRYPKFYSVLVGLSGPFSNFLLTFISMVALKYISHQTITPTVGVIAQFLTASVQINAMLGVFNLLPIPPLDGSHIIYVNLPDSWKVYYQKYQLFSLILLVILLNIPAFQHALFATIKSVIILLAHLVDIF